MSFQAGHGRAAEEAKLVGAEIQFGSTTIGHVEAVVRDPLSGRVRKLITAYGPTRRRVAVPMEWVVQHTPTRLVLGVGSRSLDDLAEEAGVREVARRS